MRPFWSSYLKTSEDSHERVLILNPENKQWHIEMSNVSWINASIACTIKIARLSERPDIIRTFQIAYLFPIEYSSSCINIVIRHSFKQVDASQWEVYR